MKVVLKKAIDQRESTCLKKIKVPPHTRVNYFILIKRTKIASIIECLSQILEVGEENFVQYAEYSRDGKMWMELKYASSVK